MFMHRLHAASQVMKTSALREGHQVGPYRIVRLLGEGGMGAVYEARQKPLDRRVALKTLHPEYARNEEAVARFFNEAKVLSRLEHPSIVQVSDFGHAPDGTAYLVMEYLRGESLARRLLTLTGQGKRLAVVTALQLAWQVADILTVAHAQGIVHRDLKPDNLMMVADPIAPGGERVKVLDFGIAKLTDASDRGGVKTDTQAVIGTPMYMSPEQCAGAGGVDAKTDVYSLGCVLYEMLGGRPPFIAEGAGQLVGMHLFREPTSLSEFAPKLPPKVAELVHLFLTKDKGKRPSMSEVADELGRLLSKISGGGPVARSRPPTNTDPDATRAILAIPASSTLGQSIGQWARSSPRHRTLIAASMAGLLAAVLVVVLLLRGGRQQALAPIQLQPAASPLPNDALSKPGSAVVASPPPSSHPTQAAGTPKSPKPEDKQSASRPSSIKQAKQGDIARPARPAPRPGSVTYPKNPKSKAFGYEE